MEAVRQAMEKRGLALYQLALLIEASETTLYRMFKGAIKSGPREDAIISGMARVLDLDAATIKAELEAQKKAWRVSVALAA